MAAPTRRCLVRWYYNPFSVDPEWIFQPDVPPGTILAYCERLR